MSEEVQERFEDYLELEQYIEQLHLQKPAHPPANLTPQQMSIYGMAMLFHSATPHVADPRPEFKEQLRQHLRTQVQAEGKRKGAAQGTVGTGFAPATQPSVPSQGPKLLRRIYKNKQASQADQASPTYSKSTNVEKTRVAGTGPGSLPRRALFAGGTLAAASLLGATAIGGAIEHALEAAQPNTTPPDHGPLVTDVPVAWHDVTTVDQLGNDAIRFTADTVVGYVMRLATKSNEAHPAPKEQIIAFSASCTHRGCIVQWQDDTRQFLCPCHNGAFDAAGNPVYTQKGQFYLAPLPPLDTKIENGHIYVKVPLPPTQDSNW